MSGFSLLLLLAGLAAAAADTPFTDCGSSSTINTLQLTGCNEVPCILHRGKDLVMDTDITAASSISSLTSEVQGIISGIPVPFYKDDKACDSLTSASCPLASGDTFAYQVSFPRAEGAGGVVACAEIPCKIQ
ncbi:NPC intracellular cholesterol transporter 2-like [Pollicipes pollicipes]|uniref:NPC intracellular cholesterol transporter 2-like n=1 Tax=Pollicipes pollicipes TaxID=41117 RepID=UPI0018852848|nr:NPC intracellular cholesterol transporter 2-like [Pollicipes pollicipes]